jgi:hypothetical protein
VAGIIISSLFIWVYGCESSTKSLLNKGEKIDRLELQAEVEYLAGVADSRIADLDKQDKIRQQLLDAANVLASGGQINVSGLFNLAASIAAISFGLNRNQAYKNALKEKTKATT